MTVFGSMAALAALFVIFGLFVGRRECTDGVSCAGCGGRCRRRPPATQEAP
jgi:hypothetical protein